MDKVSQEAQQVSPKDDCLSVGMGGLLFKTGGKNKSMQKVFIVTNGEYSDYGIEGVFLNREDAEECCKIKQGKYDSYRVEEWPLYSVKPKYYTWFCRINKKTGEIFSIQSWEPELENSKGSDSNGNYYSMGETKELAIKNAIDYRTFQLARDLE